MNSFYIYISIGLVLLCVFSPVSRFFPLLFHIDSFVFFFRMFYHVYTLFLLLLQLLYIVTHPHNHKDSKTPSCLPSLTWTLVVVFVHILLDITTLSSLVRGGSRRRRRGSSSSSRSGGAEEGTGTRSIFQGRNQLIAAVIHKICEWIIIGIMLFHNGLGDHVHNGGNGSMRGIFHGCVVGVVVYLVWRCSCELSCNIMIIMIERYAEFGGNPKKV
jgi:hypothetical protein